MDKYMDKTDFEFNKLRIWEILKFWNLNLVHFGLV